jgi:hypothetical protein
MLLFGDNHGQSFKGLIIIYIIMNTK